MSRGLHVRHRAGAGRPLAPRRLAGAVIVFLAGFALTSTGIAAGFWSASGGGPGQAQALTLSAPGPGQAGSPTTSSLQVSWAAAPGLPAGAGYKVLRSSANGGPYTAISSGTCAQDVTVASPATSCTDDDSALAPGTTYYYVVEATYYDVATLWTSATDAQFSGATSQGSLGITTTADPASVTVGGSVDDQATVTGLVGPSSGAGTITWKLYPGGDATCSGAAVFTSAPQGVTADTTYTSSSFTTTMPGTFTWAYSYSGDAANAPQSGCGGPGETLTVRQATPSLGTSASSEVTVGQSVSDTATLSGGDGPTGTITYTLYGPSPVASCTTQVGQVTTAVSHGNGAYTSPPLAPPQAGTYWWIANYGGDPDNASTANTCGAAGESSVVSPAVPTLSSTATPPAVALGGSVADQSVLAGGHSPTGTITWSLYAGGSCGGTPVFATSSGGTVSGDSTYTSTSYTTTRAGTFTWGVSYGGDAGNAPVSTCGGPGQTLSVGLNVPQVTTSADPPATTVGGAVADQATFSGLVDPGAGTGTITWGLYPSSDTTCAGIPLFASTATTVTANTTYTSSSFTTTRAGSYLWGYDYTGDAHNAARTGCGGAAESVQVGDGTAVVDLSSEVRAYDAQHTTDGISGGTPDFAFFSSGTTPFGCQGASIDWGGGSVLTGRPMDTYRATDASDGTWSNEHIGEDNGIGPIVTSPFNGVAVRPRSADRGDRGGVAAVVRFTVPAAPAGTYQPDATLTVQAAWASGASAYVYVLDGTGHVVGRDADPVRIAPGRQMDATFALPSPVPGAVYSVAVAPGGGDPTTISLDMRASLPFG